MRIPLTRTPLAVTVILACSAAVSAGSTWSSIECPEKMPAVEDRFATVSTVDDFEKDLTGWEVHDAGQNAQTAIETTADTAAGGTRSLAITYRFSGEKRIEYVSVVRPVTFKKRGLGLGFRVRGNGAGLGLKMRIKDASGETHQIGMDRMDFAGWRYVAAAIDGRAEGCWGGDGNRRLDYPCRLAAILADRPAKGFTGSGTFHIDDVAVVRAVSFKPSLEIAVRDKRRGNIYQPGETVTLRASAPAGAIRWRVLDCAEKQIAAGAGAADGTALSVRLPKPGYYEALVNRVDDDRIAETRIFACAALAPAADRRNDFVGVCTHFQRPRSWPLEAMDLLVRYGITEIRDEIPWAAVERKKGILSVPADRAAFVDRAAELKINPLMIFCYGNRFYENGGFPTTAATREAYCRFCAAEIAAFGEKVRAYEVWNEWSVGCGMRGKPKTNSPEAYAKLLVDAHRAIKKADPDVTVVGLGGEHSAHHFENIRGMLAAGCAASMDVLSVHCYRYPRTPEESRLVEEIEKVAALARKHRAPRGIRVTEIGWPTHTGPRGVDRRTQARYAVRTLALLQATGTVEKVHWYDFKDDGTDRTYNEANFGIVRHQTYNCAPKPAAVAVSVFARMTAGASLARARSEGHCRAVCYRRPDGRDLAVAWTTGRPRPVTVGGTIATVTDMMGAAVKTGDRVELTGSPLYITGRGLKMFEQSRPVDGMPAEPKERRATAP